MNRPSPLRGWTDPVSAPRMTGCHVRFLVRELAFLVSEAFCPSRRRVVPVRVHLVRVLCLQVRGRGVQLCRLSMCARGSLVYLPVPLAAGCARGVWLVGHFGIVRVSALAAARSHPLPASSGASQAVEAERADAVCRSIADANG
jgi:hypothetical protein